jgi:hypothetical protein
VRGWHLAYKLGVANCSLYHKGDLGSQEDDGGLIIIGVNNKASNATSGIGVKVIRGPLLVRYPMIIKYPNCIKSKMNTTIAYPSLVKSSLTIEENVTPDTISPIPQKGR